MVQTFHIIVTVAVDGFFFHSDGIRYMTSSILSVIALNIVLNMKSFLNLLRLVIENDYHFSSLSSQ